MTMNRANSVDKASKTGVAVANISYMFSTFIVEDIADKLYGLMTLFLAHKSQ